jgi:hypothetical protein
VRLLRRRPLKNALLLRRRLPMKQLPPPRQLKRKPPGRPLRKQSGFGGCPHPPRTWPRLPSRTSPRLLLHMYHRHRPSTQVRAAMRRAGNPGLPAKHPPTTAGSRAWMLSDPLLHLLNQDVVCT